MPAVATYSGLTLELLWEETNCFDWLKDDRLGFDVPTVATNSGSYLELLLVGITLL